MNVYTFVSDVADNVQMETYSCLSNRLAHTEIL